MFLTLDHNNNARRRKQRKEVRAKERTKVEQQKPEERFLVKNKHTNQKCGQKWCLMVQKRKQGKKGSDFSKENEGYRKGGFRKSPSGNGSSCEFYHHKEKGKDSERKEQGRCPPTDRIFSF